MSQQAQKSTAPKGPKSGIRIPSPGQRLDASAVAENFAEIEPALSRGEAFAESGRCLMCYDAPCTTACPTHIDVPAFIKKIHTGNLKGAARVILDANPMGHSCARACPVEVLCEGACVMNDAEHRPIQIARLQRHATDALLEYGWPVLVPAADTGKKVAIVGAGPAGLSCAQELRRHGHAVTIFDARSKVGGLNTWGIAQYKLTPQAALAEADSILKLGVTVKTGVTVGKEVAFSDLVRDFDAVFVGVGLGGTNRLGIPGEDTPGVIDALAFIEHLKEKPYGTYAMPETVLVVGAGNTAVDAATQARRLGARAVDFVYRRGPDDASAYHYEMELARNDGCGFHFWSTPVRIEGGDVVTGLTIKDGAGQERTLSAGLIIKAIGQEKRANELQAFGLAVDDKGKVVVDADRKTSHVQVWAGGDCINGGKEIVNAARDGVVAATAIHRAISN